MTSFLQDLQQGLLKLKLEAENHASFLQEASNFVTIAFFFCLGFSMALGFVSKASSLQVVSMLFLFLEDSLFPSSLSCSKKDPK